MSGDIIYLGLSLSQIHTIQCNR